MLQTFALHLRGFEPANPGSRSKQVTSTPLRLSYLKSTFLEGENEKLL